MFIIIYYIFSQSILSTKRSELRNSVIFKAWENLGPKSDMWYSHPVLNRGSVQKIMNNFLKELLEIMFIESVGQLEQVVKAYQSQWFHHTILSGWSP